MTVRLLDLPGIEAIERRLRLNLLSGQKGTDHELDRMVADFVRNVLGLRSRPFEAIGLDDPEDGESYFDVFSFDDEEASEIIAIWSRAGWDITSQPGTIALSYRPLAADLVTLTNRTDLAEGEGRTLMELEAEAWAAKAKPLPSGPSPADRARNQTFLNLGSTRRRPAA